MNIYIYGTGASTENLFLIMVSKATYGLLVLFAVMFPVVSPSCFSLGKFQPG